MTDYEFPKIESFPVDVQVAIIRAIPRDIQKGGKVVPTDEKQKRSKKGKQVGKLCRRLKGSTIGEAKDGEKITRFRDAVYCWFSRIPAIFKKGNGDNPENWWSHFLNMYPKSKTGETGDTETLTHGMTVALTRFYAGDFSALAKRYYDPRVRKLVLLCEELQRIADGEWDYSKRQDSFFLSGRDAGYFMGCDHNTAARLLRMLVAEGVLEKVAPGSMGQMDLVRKKIVRISTRYRFHPE